MRAIVGVLGLVYVVAAAALIACVPSPVVVVLSVVIGGCAAALSFVVWSDHIRGLIVAAGFTAAMVAVTIGVLLSTWLGGWPIVAATGGLLAGLLVAGATAGAWGRCAVVLPFEVAVLRNPYTLTLTPLRGPRHLMRLPFREIFARLPLAVQELEVNVERVDLTPRGGSSSQIDGIAIEVTFKLDPDKAMRIFAAPNWQDRVGQVMRESTELRGFRAAIQDHGVWRTVLRQVVEKQLELVVRRGAREMDLGPSQLSASRDAFEARLHSDLMAELDRFGIVLLELDVLRIDTAEVAADKQGRAYETLAAASLRAREQELQLAIDHIRRNGLPETPEMVETVMMLIGGIQGHVSVVRSHHADPEPHHFR